MKRDLILISGIPADPLFNWSELEFLSQGGAEQVIDTAPSEYRRTCETAGRSRKQIERCVISNFQIAESMGFKGEFRQ